MWVIASFRRRLLLSDPSLAFAARVLSRMRLLVWPRERRPTDARGRFGSLHAKFVLADAAMLFLTSANLTEHALRLNLELGALFRGGDLPGQLREHLDLLSGMGVMVVRS